VPGYNVAGKTGTAEKIVDGRYSENENIASFMGLLPAERPEIGIIVVLDNPQPLRTGSVSAAPVFTQIAEAAARYLDIQSVNPHKQSSTAGPQP
jgi:cell division protein FtsI/penicillin-binding protein 2